LPSFAQRLVAWQRVHGRHDLPWQRTHDPYRIWVSEIMLQQTQVSTVIPYYRRFIEAFPDVAALAAAERDRVLALWSGLGYYRRAHHLHAAAQAIVTKHGGRFPRDRAAIAALPGIGRSTAAAIVALAFGERAAILDGNVRRVLARHRGIAGEPGSARVVTMLWTIAESLLPARDLDVYTQALMDLGATVCARRAPRCGECPVAADCVALRDDATATLPAPRRRRELPHRSVRVLVIEHDGALLVEKRAAAGIWAGLWSLPELDVGADVDAHCRLRYGAELDASDALPPTEHTFTHFKLTMLPQRLRLHGARLQAEAPGQRWVTRDDALALGLPSPIRTLLGSLTV